MSDKAEWFVFLVFAVPLVAASLGVVIARSPIHSAMSLVAAFFFLAGIYVVLLAHLLAWLQVLVYAGAIMVTFLFVIMLLNFDDEVLGVRRLKVMQVLGIAGALGVAGTVVKATLDLGELPMRDVGPEFGTIRAVGRVLF